MKSRLVNISRHPSCEGARGRERQEERKRGNMRGGILLFLNPNSRIRAGSRSMLEHTIAHTICVPLHSENILKNSLYTKCPLTTDVHMERCILSCVKRKCKETTGRLRMEPYGLHWWALFPLIRNPCYFMFVVNTVVDSSISMIDDHTTD